MWCPRRKKEVTSTPGAIHYCLLNMLPPATWRQFMPDRDPLLQERKKTHGSFKLNAQIHKKLCYAYPNEPDLNAEQRLALNMIYVKIARILSGQGNHKDHWDDLAGYAKLGSEACDH